MSKASKALQHWETRQHLDRITTLLKQANDPFYPPGQAQAGIQLARVEVPWLLAYIEELQENNGSAKEPVQAVEAVT